MSERSMILRGTTEADYFADPCPEPSLSQSIAHVLLESSPMHAWARHPKLGGRSKGRTSKALDRGTLVHTLLLNRGTKIEVVDAEDWRTKDARAARDAARAAGSLPVLAPDYEGALHATDAIRDRLADLKDDSGRPSPVVFEGGEAEVQVAWQEATVSGPIWCRGAFDYVRWDQAEILDLKRARSADPEKFARSVVNYGYDVQRAAYTRALRRLCPSMAGRERFRFVVVETEEPFAVMVGELDGQFRRRGEMRWLKAVESWGFWLRERGAEQWPGYGHARIEAPGWLASQMMEEA